MSPTAQSILTEARKLSPNDQAWLVNQLMAKPSYDEDPQRVADLMAEADHRAIGVRNGTRPVTDGASVLDKLRCGETV